MKGDIYTPLQISKRRHTHAKGLRWYTLSVFKEHQEGQCVWSRMSEAGSSRRKGWGRSRACKSLWNIRDFFLAED